MLSKKFILLMLLLTSQASAYYTMELKSSVEVINDSAILHTTLIHKGDETAYNVHLFLLLPEGFSSGEKQTISLKPNASYESTFNIEIGTDTLAGTYPAVILLEYTDANGYPFSMVFPESLPYKERTFPKVYGTMGSVNITVGKGKTLNMTLRNNDVTEHNVTLRLFLPYELSSDFLNITLLMKPRSIHTVPFNVSSFGALADSSYTIVATLEYEDDIHYSSIIKGRVNVEREISPEKSAKTLLLFTVILLFIVLLLLRRK